MPLLEITNLSFTYAGAEKPALQDVSLCLEPGDFALLTGRTGCGKSTLLRQIKRELTPRGDRTGQVLFQGQALEDLSPRESAARIGFVFQRPEEQIVTDRVWHELAFGLESLGVPGDVMRRRVAEAAQFFGLEDCFDLSPDQLSGGQKQLLNRAAATVMEPDLLVLDEPAAHLDPIAAKTFLAALERLNRETGMAILLAEHRLEDSLSRAGRFFLMEEGRITEGGTPREVCGRLAPGSSAEGALPAAARLWRGTGRIGDCPLSTGEGRAWVLRRFPAASGPAEARETAAANSRKAPFLRCAPEKQSPPPALSFRETWFRFSREGPDILRSLNLDVRQGEIFAVLGGNGSGKTTLLRAAAGLISPSGGEIRLFGKRIREYRHGTLRQEGVALLPQDVQTLFLRASVREELKDSGLKPEDLPFDLSPLLDRHPYDLSGGEQQLLGLSKVLAVRPRLLLLDEPAGGLDAEWRKNLRLLLRRLREQGITILLVTHDAEFAAETADRCGLLFRGRMEAASEPHAFFAGGSYYTTSVSRMLPGCITVAEAVERLTEPGASSGPGNAAEG